MERRRAIGPRSRGIQKPKEGGGMPPTRPAVSTAPVDPKPDQTQEPVKRITPRGRGAPLKPAPPATRPAEMMQALSLGEETSSTAAKESVRGRREPSQRGPLVTKPASIVSKLGSAGKPIMLLGNFFACESLPNFTLYQYRVDFLPDVDLTRVRRAMLFQHKETLGAHIFDGTMLFMVHMLPKDPTELVVVDKISNANVKITIKRIKECTEGDVNYMHVWSLIFRKMLESMNLQLVGRDYYDPTAKIQMKEYNLEIWPGYVSSMRQYERKVLLNVDVSSKIMRNETALDLLSECQQRSGQNYKDVFCDSIVGTTVITRYNNATYQIDDVDFNSSPLSEFDMKGVNTSYVDYFKKKYGLNVREKNQPMLVTRPKARDVRSGTDKKVILIPELCCLTGMTDSMRSNFRMMRDLAEHTMVKPNVRIQRLEKGFMKRLLSTSTTQEEMKKWNVQFRPSLVEVPGRVYDPETIVHGDQRESRADVNADFTGNLRHQKMVSCPPIRTWVCIYPRRVEREIESFCSTLAKSVRSQGMFIPEPQWEELQDDRANSYVHAIEQCYQRYQPLFVLCVLLNNKGDRYEAIKKKCYVDRSLPSQCILAKNLSKGGMSVATKVAIQINCKLGGIPWCLKVPFKFPVMVAGFDVTHDSRLKGKSVGALVASVNNTFSRYFSAVSIHSSGEELSNDIASQMGKAILKFQQFNNGAVPCRIIMYRDGVGDGNIHHVLNVEVELIKKEIRKFYGDQEPKLCFIVVSKRINARVFAGEENPPPGTVVDDVITLPERYDFYLVSQSVRQGTVSPTYFNVIYDNSEQSPDHCQRLTYKLTHLYYNWSGTVRVPAPLQYAHKLAFLVGQSIHRQPSNDMDDLLYFL